MPANLPPQYFETEKKLKTAKTPEERMSILEELLSIVPKHKGTEKLQALLKTKIAKLKSHSHKKPAVARHESLFKVDKSGAGQIVLIGPPNTGKSSLVKTLTNADPEIGNYPFTTRIPYPAMMKYENIQIQLVDTPPITPDYMETGHAELIKSTDRTLLLMDMTSSQLEEDYFFFIEKLREKKIELVPYSQEIPFEMKHIKKKTLIAVNKIDLPGAEKNIQLIKNIIPAEFKPLLISALNGDNLDRLKKDIFSMLEVLRVYSKMPGKKPDLNEPFVLKKGSSLMDMAKAVHKDFSQKLKFARIWSKNKYEGQKVNRDYVLEDEDIIELHI